MTLSWRAIAFASYGPTVLAAAAIGAATPIAALRAHELGADIGLSALVVSLTGVGQLLGALPAGALVARLGERRTLLAMGTVETLALLMAGFVPHLGAMAAAHVISGFASAAYMLARQGFMIDALPRERLARGMSLLGGSLRVGILIGPAAGGAAVSLAGLQGGYGLAAAFSAAAVVLVFLAPDVTAAHERATRTARPTSVFAVARRHRRTLLELGSAVAVIQGLRGTRMTILPLWAAHIGLDGVTTSLIFAAAGVAELLVVYPSGWLMDRAGRRFAVAPTTLVLGASLVALPLARDATGLLVVAIVMALGNGMGSGIVMTMGADSAPAVDRAQFLGAWRLLGDLGYAGAPLTVTLITAASTLGIGSLSIGVVGILGAAWATRCAARLDADRESQ